MHTKWDNLILVYNAVKCLFPLVQSVPNYLKACLSLRTFCHIFYSRAALLSSEGATFPFPKPTPLAPFLPRLLPLWTWATVRPGPARLRAMQRFPFPTYHNCLRVWMGPLRLKTQVRIQPWRWFSPANLQTADRTCGWSSMGLSRRVFPPLWTYWSLPYMSQMWSQVPRKPPWTQCLTMEPTATWTTRSDAKRSFPEGEKDAFEFITCVLYFLVYLLGLNGNRQSFSAMKGLVWKKLVIKTKTSYSCRSVDRGVPHDEVFTHTVFRAVPHWAHSVSEQRACCWFHCSRWGNI